MKEYKTEIKQNKKGNLDLYFFLLSQIASL